MMIADPIVTGMSHVLTRAVTHSLAPTLSFTLSHNAAEHVACAYCRSYNSYCDQCAMDTEEIYTRQYTAYYYAAYYSDYFSSSGFLDYED